LRAEPTFLVTFRSNFSNLWVPQGCDEHSDWETGKRRPFISDIGVISPIEAGHVWVGPSEFFRAVQSSFRPNRFAFNGLRFGEFKGSICVTRGFDWLHFRFNFWPRRSFSLHLLVRIHFWEAIWSRSASCISISDAHVGGLDRSISIGVTSILVSIHDRHLPLNS
jgi:hypothetical protein